MDSSRMRKLPRRATEVVSSEFDGEFVVLDTRTDQAHALSGAVAEVSRAVEQGSWPDLPDAEVDEIVTELVERGLLVADGVSRRTLLQGGRGCRWRHARDGWNLVAGSADGCDGQRVRTRLSSGRAGPSRFRRRGHQLHDPRWRRWWWRVERLVLPPRRARWPGHRGQRLNRQQRRERASDARDRHRPSR